MNNLEQAIKELLKFVKNSSLKQQEDLAGLIRLGIVNFMEDGKTQHSQVKTGCEILNNVAFLEPYGYTAKPLPKSETLVLRVNGSKYNNVVLNIGNRALRFKELKDGEVAMYDNSGNLLHFKNGGNIDFKASTTINQSAPAINISGAETITVETKTATIKAEKATIDAAQTITTGKTTLANGSIGAAYIGCTVEVDPLTHKGTITSGSAEVLIK